MRFYHAPAQARYPTPIHFWVHALRDELTAMGRREDLVGAAANALCRLRPFDEWRKELEEFDGEVVEALLAEVGAAEDTDDSEESQVFRMLGGECRTSSVVDHRTGFVADFQGHGDGPTWRRSAR